VCADSDKAKKKVEEAGLRDEGGGGRRRGRGGGGGMGGLTGQRMGDVVWRESAKGREGLERQIWVGKDVGRSVQTDLDLSERVPHWWAGLSSWSWPSKTRGEWGRTYVGM
jgi:hypothetical protein